MPEGGRVAALLAAAGQGLRLAAGPKAFVVVRERTLLEWSVRALEPVADEVVVAVAEEDVARAEALVPTARVIVGGASRQETVARLAVETAAATVLVHDAARPFLPLEVARRVLSAAQRSGASSAALRLSDTVIDVVSGEGLDRERLRAVQTPQGFERGLLLRAHAEAAANGVLATDDAALVRRLGHQVELVEGSPLLHKITTPADLELAAGLCSLWLERRGRGEPT